MKNLSTGSGLALLAGAIVALPLLNRLSSIDQSAHAVPPALVAQALAAASTGQAAPTIVWYGVAEGSGYGGVVFRSWSNGRIEALPYDRYYNGADCTRRNVVPSVCGWELLSDQHVGYSAAADINFDSKVDGDDLGQVLAAWGPAPRHDLPPSDCPLDLINP